jgi:phospholipase C
MPGPELIKHLVIVMMENRSFDHYLGALTLAPETGHAGLEGLGDGQGNLRAGLPVNLLNGLAVPPWQLDEPNMPHPSPPWVQNTQGRWLIDHKTFDPPHEWKYVRPQFAGGTLDGFIDAYRAAYRAKNKRQLPDDTARLAMGYYTRNTLPVLYALADELAVCDHWFSSFLGSTWPNRVFANSGRCGDLISTEDVRDRFDKFLPRFVWESWGHTRSNGQPFWKAYFFKRREEFTMFDLWPGAGRRPRKRRPRTRETRRSVPSAGQEI